MFPFGGVEVGNVRAASALIFLPCYQTWLGAWTPAADSCQGQAKSGAGKIPTPPHFRSRSTVAKVRGVAEGREKTGDSGGARELPFDSTLPGTLHGDFPAPDGPGLVDGETEVGFI